MAGQAQQQLGDGSQAAAMESMDAVSAAATSSSYKLEEPDHSSSNWYFPREYIEKSSPSRLDGIDLKKETFFRKSYCTFLQDLGMRLKVPQVTIATAIVFCHRFFLRQSHLKNDRYLIATTCMFLAGKVEETPQKLRDVIFLSYEIRNKKDPTAIQRIKQQDVFEEQKEIVLLGERMVLATLGFDLNIHHPYKPLVAAIKKFKVAQNALAQVAWNFVNDGLRTSLCLQFKPHHIAAGAIFLAAKFLKVKLPSEGEKVWWQEFDVTPRQLEEVSNQMLELYEQNREVPSSRTSEPSASIGTINRRKPTVDVPSSSGVQSSEKPGDVKSKENLNNHKRSASEAFPASASTISDKMKEQNDEYTVELKPRTGVNIKVDTNIGVDEAKPEATNNNATPGSEMPHPAVEETNNNIAAEVKPQTSCSPAPEEEISTARIGESRAAEDFSIACETNLTASVEDGGPKQDSSKQDSSQQAQHQTDWVDLGNVNIDRVKAALQRRRQGGEVRASIPKRELTDEEELLEMDLENGHQDKQHDRVSEDASDQEDRWKDKDQLDANNKKENDCNSERYLDNDEDEIYHQARNRQKPQHYQKSDLDDDSFRHEDMERDLKKPRVEYRN